MSGFGSIKPVTGANRGQRIDEQVDILKLDKKWASLRFVGGRVMPVATHWMDIIGSKSKEKVSISKTCIGFNMESENHDSDNCPYCKIGLNPTIAYYANAIDRNAQENEPRKKPKPTKEEAKTGFKDKESETWTPVRVIRIPAFFGKEDSRSERLEYSQECKGQD